MRRRKPKGSTFIIWNIKTFYCVQKTARCSLLNVKIQKELKKVSKADKRNPYLGANALSFGTMLFVLLIIFKMLSKSCRINFTFKFVNYKGNLRLYNLQLNYHS